MTDTAFNLGLLKGFLLTTNAPAEVLRAIEQLRVASSAPFVSNGDVRMKVPDVAELAAAIRVVSETAPSHDESRFAAPEVTQPEASARPAYIEDTQEDEVVPVSTGGATLRKPTGRSLRKLEAHMLPAIEQALASQTFDKVGAIYGVAGNSIRSFLRRNGVDDKRYVKPRGVQRRDADQADSPDTTAHLKNPPSPLTDEQKARIREMVALKKPFNEIATKLGRRNYGKILTFYQTIQNESVSMRDAETVIDDRGRKVTKLPPGYAMGAYPQRSVATKEGR